MILAFKALFREPVPTHAKTQIHPDGSVHWDVEGRCFFAGFVGPDNVVILARPYSIAVISGSLNQVLRRSRAVQPPCIN